MAKKPSKGEDAQDEAKPALPARIKMVRPHGFIEEETGVHRYWQLDQEVFEPSEIALLIERGAEFVVIEQAPQA